jgi:hypothetical protein
MIFSRVIKENHAWQLKSMTVVEEAGEDLAYTPPAAHPFKIMEGVKTFIIRMEN